MPPHMPRWIWLTLGLAMFGFFALAIFKGLNPGT